MTAGTSATTVGALVGIGAEACVQCQYLIQKGIGVGNSNKHARSAARMCELAGQNAIFPCSFTSHVYGLQHA